LGGPGGKLGRGKGIQTDLFFFFFFFPNYKSYTGFWDWFFFFLFRGGAFFQVFFRPDPGSSFFFLSKIRGGGPPTASFVGFKPFIRACHRNFFGMFVGGGQKNKKSPKGPPNFFFFRGAGIRAFFPGRSREYWVAGFLKKTRPGFFFPPFWPQKKEANFLKKGVGGPVPIFFFFGVFFYSYFSSGVFLFFHLHFFRGGNYNV